MERFLAALGLALCACGSEQGRDVVVTSEIDGLDQLSVTVLEPLHAVISDQRIPKPAHTVELPARFVLDEANREGSARILIWGMQGSSRAAFGVTPFVLGEAGDIEVHLAAPPPDCDSDGIPDSEDGCPEQADPEQDDADGDGVTAACAANLCPGNVFADPGFESSISGWISVNGTPSWVDGGRGRSQKAGRACKTTGATYVSLKFHNLIPTLVVGSQINVRGFVRAAPGLAGPAGAHAQILFDNRNNVGTDVTPNQCWQSVTVMTTVGASDVAPGDVSFVGTAPVPDGGCFDVDDVCAQVTP